MLKECRGCGWIKPHTQFLRKNDNKDDFLDKCMDCNWIIYEQYLKKVGKKFKRKYPETGALYNRTLKNLKKLQKIEAEYPEKAGQIKLEMLMRFARDIQFE